MMYLDNWIHAHPEWKESAKQPPKAGDFNKVRTRLIALYGDTSVAHSTFDAALGMDQNDPLASYGKGLVLDREGNKKEAAEYLKKAVELRPLDGDLVRDLGKAYFHRGDYGPALKALKTALAFNSGDPEGRFLLGRAQMMTDDLQGALETFKVLLREAPEYLPGTYYLGETYGKLGDLPEAHFHLGMYYKEKGPPKNARFHLKRALELSARDPARQETIRKALKDLPRPGKSGGRKGGF
jgi:tetratricopeptide (TPR) repeat protein